MYTELGPLPLGGPMPPTAKPAGPFNPAQPEGVPLHRVTPFGLHGWDLMLVVISPQPSLL